MMPSNTLEPIQSVTPTRPEPKSTVDTLWPSARKITNQAPTIQRIRV